MRRRSNLLVVLGIAFFLVGGLLVYLLTDDEDDGDGGAASAPVTVVVGTEDIAAGALADELIDSGRLTTVEVPAGQVTPGAVQSVNQLAGATFIQGFAKDQQITATGLQLQSRTFEVPEGYDAIAVQLDFVAGAAGYATQGDRLNLYGMYSTAGGATAVPRAELLLTNVEVLDVDLTIPARRGSSTAADPATSGTPRPSASNVTYLLAVRPQDAEKIVFTTEFADLYATLTATDAAPAGPTEGRDGGTILAEEPNAAFNG